MRAEQLVNELMATKKTRTHILDLIAKRYLGGLGILKSSARGAVVPCSGSNGGACAAIEHTT
eukprot:scaffold5551_cov159-Ochromonas_danica.AAC.20